MFQGVQFQCSFRFQVSPLNNVHISLQIMSDWLSTGLLAALLQDKVCICVCERGAREMKEEVREKERKRQPSTAVKMRSHIMPSLQALNRSCPHFPHKNRAQDCPQQNNITLLSFQFHISSHQEDFLTAKLVEFSARREERQ